MTGHTRHSGPALTSRALGVLPLAALTLLGTGCGEPQAPPDVALDEVPLSKPVAYPLSRAASGAALRMSPVPPVPDDPTNAVFADERAAELGRALFHSRALSKGERIACVTCHSPVAGLADGKRLGVGVLPLERHSMSLWNVAHNRWFFWDGRADSLWSQALVPIEDPLEHAFSRTEVARAVATRPELRQPYEALFGALPADFTDEERFPPYARPVPDTDRAHQLAREHAQRASEGDTSARPHHEHASGSGFYHPHQRGWDAMAEDDRAAVNRVFSNVGKCIAAFERRMRSARAPFDVFVEGLREGGPKKIDALSPAAVRGFELFVGEAKCAICHSGPLFTDFEFHDTRVPAVEGAPADDPGRRRGVERLIASEFGVASAWSDDPEGPATVKVEFLRRPGEGGHIHANASEFKTPSLRNVALTAPYMHNGAFETLDEVVRFYDLREDLRPSTAPGETILQPLGLTEAQRADLVAFLESLTDDSLDPAAIAPPASTEGQGNLDQR